MYGKGLEGRFIFLKDLMAGRADGAEIMKKEVAR